MHPRMSGMGIKSYYKCDNGHNFTKGGVLVDVFGKPLKKEYIKPELEGVNAEELEQRESIWYLKESKTPYTGKAYSLHANRQKAGEWNYKDGKQDGLFVWWNEKGKKVEEENYINGKQDGLDVHWHNNGQKSYEANYKDGKLIEGSEKFWTNKGDSVDIKKEAEAE